jgi:predicted nucleic acid-binding protein
MKVIVDSSVWVDYFRGVGDLSQVDWLIDEGLIVTNDLILAELIPSLMIRRQHKLIDALNSIENVPLSVDWDGIIDLQVTYLRHGINKVGIPDLIVAQQAIQNGLALLSLDKHFALMSRHIPLLVQ